jgi:hypothetical protein
MSKEHPKLTKAIEKVLLELNNCILERRAYNKFISLKTAHGLDFFRICAYALKNDIYAGAYRAFDRHKDAVSFWNIRNIAPEEFAKAASDSKIDIKDLEKLAEKLKPIRDRVHFHVDRRDLQGPNDAWKDADMTGNEFNCLTEKAHKILRIMYLELTGQDSTIPDYIGEDIEKRIRAYKEKYPDAPLTI